MKCTTCRTDKAIIELPRHRAVFCKTHFLEYFDRQVQRAIRRQCMFSAEDRVLVGVSGGKDSLALWHVLSRMGYETTGLHIQLGIGEYSARSYARTVEFAERQGLDLIVVDLAEKYGMGVPELSNRLNRVPCSGCGLSKRYILNKEAHERGYDVAATGHNLDDEAATLMGNVLHWQMGYLARQHPVLPENGEKLVKKVKPLFTLAERETAAYVLLHGIDYVDEECPNAVGARSMVYKDALNRIEAQSPGAKQSFVTQFIEKAQPKLEQGADDDEVRDCAACGQPTTGEICSFCRMWQTAHQRPAQPTRSRKRRKRSYRKKRKALTQEASGSGQTEREDSASAHTETAQRGSTHGGT